VFTRYKALLEKISRFGTLFSPPPRYSGNTNLPEKPLLRHDIDFSIFGLEAMGILENDYGHRAIYLFRPDARSYNLESAETFRVIKSLQSMGHDIGLHIDRRSHIATTSDQNSVIKYFDYMSSKLQLDLSFLSWHRPRESDLGNSEPFCGLESLYSELYWNRAIYLSDSAGDWSSQKEDKLYSFLQNKGYFQLLIHPEWWLDADAISGFVHSYSSQLRADIDDLRNHIRTFDDFDLEQRIFDSL
jgi:hypothetical protein